MRPVTTARTILTLALAVPAVPLLAQGTGAVTQLPATPAASLERLEISLWPEYDRPAMLVLYRATLAANAKLPATVALPIPANVGQPHAVAMAGEDGRLLNAQFTREEAGEWARITILTESLAVQLEYYAELAIEGSKRRFVFSWPGGPEVGSFVVDVQQPPTATGLTLMPAATARSVHPDGLTYHRGELGSVKAGQTARLEMTYDKASPALTSAAQAPASAPTSAATAETPAAASAPAESPDPALLIVFGLLAVVVVAFFMATRPGSKGK